MSQIVIDSGRLFKTVAWLDHKKITKIRFFKEEAMQLQGTLFLGRVASLAKSLDSAFVDIGLEKPGFLHFRDFPIAKEPHTSEGAVGKKRTLKVGDAVLVQVAKDPVGDKGAKLTGYVNIRGLHGVLLPFEKGIYVSKEIGSKVERTRLKTMAETLLPKGYGLVIRTLSQGMDEMALGGVITSLMEAWETMKQTATWAYPPKVMHKNSWTDQILEELLNGSVSQIIVNSPELAQSLQKRLGKDHRKSVVLENRATDLLIEYGVREAMDRLLDRKIPLPSGGHLTFDMTEALTVYDVNSGAMMSEASLEQTAYKLNEEAVEAALDHMLLANIGGMILLDLVEVRSEKTRDKLLQLAVESARTKDAAVCVHDITKLGILEMTRTREMDSFYGMATESCTGCDRMGIKKNAEWVFNEIAGRLDDYGAEGYSGVHILISGTEPDGLKAYVDQHCKNCGMELKWEHDGGCGKFGYKIRPQRSKIS